MAGMLGNFATFTAMGTEHHTETNRVPPPIRIKSRVSRYSYGYRDPNGPSNQVIQFVSEVRLALTSPLCLGLLLRVRPRSKALAAPAIQATTKS